MVMAVAVASLAVAASAQCLEARGPLAAGAVPRAANFEAVVCPQEKIARAFAYDHVHGCTHAIRAIAAGDIVPAYPEFVRGGIEPGQTLQLVISNGPVRIAREVQAMQAAKSGQKLFVKTDDGQILSVRYESRAP